jgi:dTDP-4-dehydrorhamnose 3,5-epimerase
VCAQENYSYSAAKHTVRGLHWQTPPHAQQKMVQVLHGKILDVAVDVRLNSPWFGQHVSVELSANNLQQLYVPAGFAHGFCTLESDTSVLYRVDAFYSAKHDGGIRWNDPNLGIAWPTDSAAAAVSDKDHNLPLLADCELPFLYIEQTS